MTILATGAGLRRCKALFDGTGGLDLRSLGEFLEVGAYMGGFGQPKLCNNLQDIPNSLNS